MNGEGGAAIAAGQKYVGKSKYVFGGGRSNSDIAAGRFDCSSFVNWAYGQAGVKLSPQGSVSTETLNKKGTKISYNNIQVGDMVFFDTYKKDGHVGIYQGNGKFIGAQSSTGVATADMSSGYWKQHFSGHVRRVAGGGGAGKSTGQGRQPEGALRASGSGGSGGSPSYSNTWKLKKEATKSPGYKSFKQHLISAVNTGKVPASEAVALAELIGRESSWNAGASNPKSTARGYGQFLSSTRAQYEKKMKMSYSVPVNQIAMTRQYAIDRYGSVAKALQFWDKHNYY